MKNSNAMADHAELKRAAEAASQGRWNQDGFDVQNDDIEDYRVSRCNLLTDAKFIAAANPTAVLALIAENERLRVDLKSVVRLNNENADLFKAENERLESEAVYSAAGFDAAREEISKLRAEISGLNTGYEAYERVNAELKSECARSTEREILQLAEIEALRRERDARHPFKPFHEPAIGFTGCVICGVYTDHGGLPCTKMRATADAALGQGEQS